MTDSTDVISSDEPGEPGGRRPRESAPAGTGVRTTAMTAALTLVVAAGVATAAYRGTSNETSPTSLIPASAFAVATADLSLPDGQAGGLETILGRFPGLHLTGDGSIRDRVLRTLIGSADDSIDYDQDVKPWLGDHVAVAGWARDGHPQMEVVLQSTDDSRARASLSREMHGDGAVEFRDGYAVLASSSDAVQSALAAAAKASLDDTGPYADDIKALGHSEAITAWFDGPAAKDLLSTTFMGGSGLGLAGAGINLLGPGMGELLKGRVALGVHVTDTLAQIDMRSVGSPTFGAAPSTMLTSLPSGTVGAIEFGDPGAVVDAITPLVRVFGSFTGSSTTCFGSSVTPVPSGVPDQSLKALRRRLMAAIPPGTAHRRAIIRHGLRNYRMALRQAHRSNSTVMGSDDNCMTVPSQPTDPFAAIQQAIGIRFPDDVKTILGDRAVVAFGGLELAGLPDVAIRSHPSDLATAQSLANTMSSTLAGSSPVNVDVSAAGDDLVLATSSGYGQEVAKDGDLGAQSQVETALDAMPSSVSVAGYVNLSRVWPLLGNDLPQGIEHVHAIGFWAGSSGDVQTAQLRAVFG